MLAWALLLLTLLGGATAGYLGYEKWNALEASAKEAQASLADARRQCDTERTAAAAKLEEVRAENRQLEQERAELTASRDEALRAADETGSALEKVKAKPAPAKRRR